jgi:hypothetical protein
MAKALDVRRQNKGGYPKVWKEHHNVPGDPYNPELVGTGSKVVGGPKAKPGKKPRKA